MLKLNALMNNSKNLSFKYYKSGNEVQLTIATIQYRNSNIRVIYIKKADGVFPCDIS